MITGNGDLCVDGVVICFSSRTEISSCFSSIYQQVESKFIKIFLFLLHARPSHELFTIMDKNIKIENEAEKQEKKKRQKSQCNKKKTFSTLWF